MFCIRSTHVKFRLNCFESNSFIMETQGKKQTKQILSTKTIFILIQPKSNKIWNKKKGKSKYKLTISDFWKKRKVQNYFFNKQFLTFPVLINWGELYKKSFVCKVHKCVEVSEEYWILKLAFQKYSSTSNIIFLKPKKCICPVILYLFITFCRWLVMRKIIFRT